jgi:glycosyltransferase involved in cell wall biosynthesis
MTPVRTPVTIVAFAVGPRGGMEAQLTHLVGGLLDCGHPVVLVASQCDVRSHPLLTWRRVPAPARPFPLRYIVFALYGSLQVRRWRRGLVQTFGAVVLNSADITWINHCHAAVRGTCAPALSSQAGRLYRINTRVSGWLARLGERLVYRPSRTCHAVVATPEVREEVTRFFPAMRGRITVIPNGVDANRFRPDPDLRSRTRRQLGLTSELCVLFLGGDWPRKGLHLAIEAVARVDQAHLLVVGRGQIDGYFKLARGLGAADRVSFLGSVADVHPPLVASDVFILPSVYETWSLPAYEAAACGLPLLATRVHGVTSLLLDGSNGWFIARDPAEIAHRLRLLWENPHLRLSFGAASRRRAMDFTWDRMVQDFRSLYTAVAADAVSARA